MPSCAPESAPKSVVFSSELKSDKNSKNAEDDNDSLRRRTEEDLERAGSHFLDGSESDNENEELLFPCLYPVVFSKLKQTTPPRKLCLRIAASPWFERASMFVIIVNCITLGLYQPCEHSNDLHCETTTCTVLEICDHCVFAFFAAEMIIKMIALGVWGKRGYLGESWNILDMVIVFFGILEYLLQSEKFINFTSIRTVRVLRPLRAINRVPSMRILVMLLLDTLPMLGNVLLLCFFVFFAFGVVAVQLWSGILRQRCSPNSSLFNITENGAVFLKETNMSVPLLSQFSFDEEEAICAKKDEPGEFHCWNREIIPLTKIADVDCTLNITAFENGFPANRTQTDSSGQLNCIDWNQYYSECTEDHDNPFKGAINFDNVLYAWVTIFQVISLEGWVDIMYHVMDAYSFYSFIYFILLIVVGSFFMINLCLVVIATQFSETKQREQKLIDEQRLKFKSNDSTLASYSPPGNFYEEIFKAVAHVYRKNKRKLMKRWRRWKVNREEKNKHNKAPKRKGDVPGGRSSRKKLKSVHYHHHHHHHHHYHISETPIDNPTRILKALDSPNQVLEEGDVVDLQDSKSSPPPSTCRMITDGKSDSIDPVTSKIALRLPFPTLSNGSSMHSVASSMTSERRSPTLSERRQSAEVIVEPTGAVFIKAGPLNQGPDETKARFQTPPSSSARYDSYVTSKLDCSCRFYDVSNKRFEPDAEEVFDDVTSADAKRSHCCDVLVRFLKASKKKVCKCISRASQRMKRLVDSKYYNQGIMAAILINTLSMGIEHHKQDPVLTSVLETSNIVFTTIFALEMASKLFAYGVIGYIKNFYNVFDAIIVIISVWEICEDGGGENGGGGLSVLRTFRLLRVLKLVRFLPALRRQLVVLMKTMDNVFTFMMLLALFIFIFSILGMHLFGCKFCWKNSRGTTDCDRKNFDSLLWAFVTVFQILTQEDWNMVLYNGMAASSPYAAIYFVTLMTIGNYVLFNLLVAILVEGFQAEFSSEGAQKIRQLRPSLAETDGSPSDIHILAEEYTNRVAQSLGLPVPSLHANRQQANGLDEDEDEEEYTSTDEDTDIELQLLADNPEIKITDDDNIEPTMQNNTGNFKGLPHPLPIITRTSATPTSSPTPCGTPDIQLAALAQSFKDGSGDVFQDESDGSQRGVSDCGTPIDQAFSVQLTPEGFATSTRPRLCSVGSSLSAESSNLSRTGSWRSRRKKPLPMDQQSLISWKDDECGYEEENEELLQTLRDPFGQSCSYLYAHEVKTRRASSLDRSYSDRGSMSVLSFNLSKTSRTSSMIRHRDDCSPCEESVRYSIGCAGCKIDLPRSLVPKRDWSLFLLKPTNLFRRLLLKVVANKWFDYVILMFIFGNCVTIAMDRPSLRPEDPERYILDVLNYVFIGVFTMELLLKVLAYGFCIGPKTYMKSGWNVLDFFLVVTSLVDIVLTLALDSGSKGLGVLRGFRLLRALRPLRVINRASGLKLVVQTLISSLKPIGNIVAICCAFFIIFGILGVQLFRGKFYHCEGDDLFNVTDRLSCDARNYTWVNQRYNFDDLGQALMSLFVLSSKDGWVEIMYSGIDAVGVDKQPQENYNPPVLVYFISFLLIVGFFVINMFVGVVVENFHRCREEHELEECRKKEEARQRKQEKLLRKQSMKEMKGERKETLRRKTLSRARSYADGARVVFSSALRSLKYCCGRGKAFQGSENYYASYGKTRMAIHKLCTNTYFELAVSTVIGINILTMAAEHYQQPDALEEALKYANYVFTAVFVVEALIKLIALGVCRYFKDKWNWLDMIIVLGSLLGIFIEDVWSNKKIPINPTIIRFLRVLRIARVVKLFKISKGILALLQTVACALPQVVNLGVLFMLLFFTFAALGVELFGTLTCDEEHHCDGLNRLASFQNFGIALLTLFRISTGDNWNGIMKDTLREDCDSEPNCTENCCVSNIVVPVYFVVFVMMAQFVLVNVVVAVLMKQLEESRASNSDDDKEDSDDVFDEDSEEKELQEEKSGIEISDTNSDTMQKKKEDSLERNEGVSNAYVTIEDDVAVGIEVIDSVKTSVEDPTTIPNSMETKPNVHSNLLENEQPTSDEPTTTEVCEVIQTQPPSPKEDNSSQRNDVINEQTKHFTCSRQSSEIVILPPPPPPPPPATCSANNIFHVSGCRSVGTSPKRMSSHLHGEINSRTKSTNLPSVMPCYSSKSTNELSSIIPTPTPSHRPLKNCCSAPSASGSGVKAASLSGKADDIFPVITPDKRRRIKRHFSDNPVWVRSNGKHVYHHHHYHLPAQSLSRSVSNGSVSPQTAAPNPANISTQPPSQDSISVDNSLAQSLDVENSVPFESGNPHMKEVKKLSETTNCNSEADHSTTAKPTIADKDEIEPLLNTEHSEDPLENTLKDKSSTLPSVGTPASTQNTPNGSWVAFDSFEEDNVT